MNPAETPQAFVTPYEDASAYWSIGILWNVLIPGDQSFGNFTLLDQTMPAGAGPPSHMHERTHEGFYIIEGEITYTVGPEDETVVAGPGAAVWIPPGTPHSFKVTAGPARALNFYTPGGSDDQFSYLATPATQKTLPPQDLAPINSSARDDYLARIRDLHQETLLAEQKIW
jgi:mannose-6-phosphate isomerase-like protein (cupin superfamily)